MKMRRFSLLAAICSPMLAPVWALAQQDDSWLSPTAVNQPFEIQNSKLTLEVEAPAHNDIKADSLLAARGSHASGRETALLEESRSLGQPNAAFSIRPSPSNDAGTGEAGALSSVDPRRNDIARVIAALSVVVALLFCLRWVLRRASFVSGVGRPSGVVEILARYPVARGQQLIILKLGRRVLLVHQCGSAMTTLTELTDADEVASLLVRIEAGSGGKAAMKFSGLLDRFRREHEGADDRSGSLPLVPRGPVIDLTRQKNTSGNAPTKRWRLTA